MKHTNQITITLGAHHLDVATLITSLEQTLVVLRSIESHVNNSAEIKWDIVASSMNSPLSLTLEPRSNGVSAPIYSNAVVQKYANGLRLLNKRPDLPEGFDGEAMGALRKIAEVATKDRTEVSVQVQGTQIPTTSAEVLGRIQLVEAKAASHYEHGTIEGSLEMISKRRRDHFVIWEVLTNNRVECNVTTELFQQAKEHLGERVAVSGRIRSAFGKPKSIQVESIAALRKQKTLRPLDQYGPINITGGLSSEAYVRGLRDVD